MIFEFLIMLFQFRFFAQQQKGVTSIEYGLIASALAVFVVTVLYGDNALTTAVKEKFEIFSELIIKAVT